MRAPFPVHVGIHPEHPAPETVRFAHRVEAGGFAGLWVADSQDLFRDCFVTLAVLARATSALRLTTGVTNPALRHPSVLAGGAATLAEVAPGRIALGIGTGETSVQTAGVRPATRATLEAAIERIRSFLAEPWGAAPIDVPVILAATGPLTLALAGRVADGAYVKVGLAPELLAWVRDRLGDESDRRGAARPCTLTAMVPVAVADTIEAARREVGGFAAASASAVAAAVPADALPPRLRGPVAEVAELVAAVRARTAYASWLDDPSLLGQIPDEIIEHFSVAVTDPAEVGERLATLAVDAAVVPLLTGRRDEQLERIAGALSEHPASSTSRSRP